jgi:predicted ArsR family transcriptional regulator
MYYNTTNETNPELSASIKQTEKQDAKVLNYFLSNPNHQKTALELADELGILFTSVRRSCTNLIDAGKLVYCGTKMERYGKINNLIGLPINYQTKLNL